MNEYWFEIALRRSRPVSNSSFTSVTPITNQRSINSSVELNRTVMPEIETKPNEISNHLKQLEVDSAFLVSKSNSEFFCFWGVINLLIRQLNMQYIEKIIWMNFYQMVIPNQ